MGVLPIQDAANGQDHPVLQYHGRNIVAELFFDNFGRSIKFGIYQSYGAKAAELGPLLMFYSMKEDKYITLDEYVEAMADDQADIYYAAGDSTDRLRNLPIVKTIRSKGYDVLLCTQDVDEFTLQMMQAWKEKELKNVSTSDIDLATEDEKKVAEEATEENKEFFEAMKEVLGNDVSRVEVSPNAIDAPARLTTVGQMSLEMERILAQGPEGSQVRAERVLQVNIQHPAFETLKAAFDAGDKEKTRLYTGIFYNQALLVEGMPIEDPLAFAQAISKLMV